MENIPILNLKTKMIERFWQNKNHELGRILNEMDGVEFWTTDDDKDVMVAIERLTKILNEDLTEDKLMEEIDKFFVLLAYMKASKALRFIAWVEDKFKPTVSAKILNIAIKNMGNNIFARLYCERISFIKEMKFLQMVFTKSRIEEIKRILSKLDQEGKL